MKKEVITNAEWVGACAAPINEKLFTTQPIHVGMDSGLFVAVARDPVRVSKFHVKVFGRGIDTLKGLDVRTLTFDMFTNVRLQPVLDALGNPEAVPAAFRPSEMNPRLAMLYWHIAGGDVIHGGHAELVEEGLRSQVEDGSLCNSGPLFLAMVLALHTATFYEEPATAKPAESEPMTISYDEKTDVVTICGQKFTGEFFRTFGYAPMGTWIRIDRDEDNKVVINRPGHDQQVMIDYAVQCCDTGTHPGKIEVQDISTSRTIGQQMVDALGLSDRSIASLRFTVEARDMCRLEVLENVYQQNAENITQVLRHYKLVPLDEGESDGDRSPQES